MIFGVDIQSGDVRGDAPSYAVVAFDGEHVDRDVVSYRKLCRLIEREKPDILATDNVYELAADKDALVGLLRDLPSGTTLVQVTGAERPEPLSRVASRHGVPYGKKPMKEAEAAARLAAGNVGHEVRAFTNTTRIKVSRGRSTGKGGWSADRYTRRIHGAVKKRSREIESELKGAGLDYEVNPTEKYGGYSKAVFVVKAEPGEIPVSTGRAGDVRVEMERERTDGIEFEPLAKRRDYVLVGIDPGTTTAVAIVGIDGGVLDVLSTRTADTAAVIEWIVERGRPFLVAADVRPMPNTVEKIRRSFDAASWIPGTDLPVDEKQHRTRNEGYDNDHERDAIAAALFAHDDHAEQFERVARKTPARIDTGEVIARVVGGESVEAVLDSHREDESDDEEATAHAQPERSPEQKRIADLERQVDRLKAHVSDLKDTVEERDERIDDLEADLTERRSEERKEVRRKREITRLERETDRLERERDEAREERDALSEKLDRLKELWKLDHSNFADVEGEERDLVPVKPIEKFTLDAIEAAEEAYGLSKGDVILLRDASGAGPRTAERLAAVSPRVVLKNGGLSESADEVLFEEGIPVGAASEVAIREVDELAVARESEVEAVVEGWHERAEQRRRERNASMVDQLISEHRAESR
nr:DUF460 domain-containing protein [Halalkalicoccus sp. NIPERK01]